MNVATPQYRCLEINDPQVVQLCDKHAALFEQTYAWLSATKDLLQASKEELKLHTLVDNDNQHLLLLWPLIHRLEGNTQQISSVTSCYSTNVLPYYVSQSNNTALTKQLLIEVSQRYPWDEIRIGPFDCHRVSGALLALEKPQKDYSVIGHWFVDHVSHFSEYLSQRPGQLKNTLKRKAKKLYQDHEVKIVFANTPTQFDSLYTDYQQIYRDSWKGDEASYQFIAEVSKAALAQDKLRFAVMYADGKAVAAQIWFIQHSTASIFKLAYDPEFSHYSVGSILSEAMCERVIDDDKCHTIEFGCGNEAYKRAWMTQYRERRVVQVFNGKTILGKMLIFKHIYLARLKSILKTILRKK
ncbi:GNAT family N-acetyltransferase [Thalassotalea fusca]